MTDRDDELAEIREQKLQELRDGTGGGTSDASADDAAPDEPVHLGDGGDYEGFLAEHRVVLVDFHADWCGPCQMLEPVVADVAAETDAAVLKVDVDAHQGLAAEMRVRGVPALYLYRDGAVVEQLVGVQETERLVALVEDAL
jgi:thioredoxin 1